MKVCLGSFSPTTDFKKESELIDDYPDKPVAWNVSNYFNSTKKKPQMWKWTSFEKDPKLSCLQIGRLFQNV